MDLEAIILQLNTNKTVSIQSAARSLPDPLLLEAALANLCESIITVDGSGRLKYMNPAGEFCIGCKLAEVEGAVIEDLFELTDRVTGVLVTTYDLMRSIQSQPVSWFYISKLKRSSAAVGFIVRITPFAPGSGVAGAVIVIDDASETNRLPSSPTIFNSYDVLTNLENRISFEDQLQKITENVHSCSSKHAVLYMDLDQFKVVNDILGYVAGDELLRQITLLIKETLSGDEILARIGGDEFGLLLQNYTLDQANQLAQNIIDSISNYRFFRQQRMLRIGVSIGLVSIDSSTHSGADALRDAEAACYIVKETGRNRVHICRDDDQVDRRRVEMTWVEKIDNALEHDQFVLYAQEIKSLEKSPNDGEHFEILLRMMGDKGETIAPGCFLPCAEKYNLAMRIDRWVVENTLKWLADHFALDSKIGLCSINVSGQSLGDPKFLDFVLNQIDEFDMSANKICFEITETAAIHSLSHALTFMNTLKKKGCQFALDDFGSGLSSFAYLKTLKVDYLKIDGLFIRNICNDDQDFAMVRSINEIGHQMGMKTIAEFVEDENIQARLSKIGVNYVQGYGVGMPKPLEQLFKNNNTFD